jgi:hypothetical protein
MFYGTAQFGAYIVGSTCYLFGLQFDTHNPDAALRKLPPGFRFVRLLHIRINLSWPWNPGEHPNLDWPLPGLPLRPPGTALITECLSKGSDQLRQVTLQRVQVIDARMPALIDCTLDDRGRLFRAVLKHFLAPLRVLRGVDLKYDDLWKFGSHRLYYSRIIGDSQRSWEEALRVFAALERIRMSFLHGLAERVSQHT